MSTVVLIRVTVSANPYVWAAAISASVATIVQLAQVWAE